MRSDRVNLIFLQTLVGISRRLVVLLVVAVPLGFASSAVAAAGEPTIGGVSATNITEGGATLEAQIDPEGSETTFEILLECQVASLAPGVGCGSASEPVPGDTRGQGDIAAGFEERTVGVTVTGLHPGYSYWYGVLATNSSGKTESLHHLLQTSPPGACPGGCPSSGPYEAPLEPWVGESEGKWGEGGTAREAARQQAAKEQAEREAAARRADQPIVTPTSSPPAAVTGGVSLASTSITVRGTGRGVALVELSCLGVEGCRGKLTLTANDAVRTKGAVGVKGAQGKRARAVSIGTVSYAVAGDETKTVKVELDTSGRALLNAAHGSCSASLAILELAPSPKNTQTRSVRLVQGRPPRGRTHEQAF